MATLQKKDEQGANRTSAGWNQILFSEFRKNPGKPEVKRVERILSMLVAAENHLSEVHSALRTVAQSKAHFLVLHRKSAESTVAYNKALQQLDDALKQYHWRSTIFGDLDGFGEVLEHHARASTQYRHWEGAIVRRLLALTRERGALARFRKCSHCNQWFYGATAHQRFCGEACRRKYVSSSPEFKEKRRVYMREKYRPQQKQLEERSLALLSKRASKRLKG